MRPSQESLPKKTLYDIMVEDNGKEYYTSYKGCRKWFDILNECVFGNKLPFFDKVFIDKQRKHNALFCYDKETKENDLMLNTHYKNEKVFVLVMAHEMIHLFQLMYDEPLGHGVAFFIWKENLQIHKIILSKEI